jgi:hypothetical protein
MLVAELRPVILELEITVSIPTASADTETKARALVFLRSEKGGGSFYFFCFTLKISRTGWGRKVTRIHLVMLSKKQKIL